MESKKNVLYCFRKCRSFINLFFIYKGSCLTFVWRILQYALDCLNLNSSFCLGVLFVRQMAPKYWDIAFVHSGFASPGIWRMKNIYDLRHSRGLACSELSFSNIIQRFPSYAKFGKQAECTTKLISVLFGAGHLLPKAKASSKANEFQPGNPSPHSNMGQTNAWMTTPLCQ